MVDGKYPNLIDYRAVPKQVSGGRTFASKLEGNLYQLLNLRVRGGELKDLKCQVHVYLTSARIHMIPDFSAIDTKTNELEYYEGKGFETPVWRIKRKLWKYYGWGPLFVYKAQGNALVLHETIIPKCEEE